MIKAEKLNGDIILINPDYIKLIESTPDTVVTLNDGEKLIFKTKMDEFLKLILEADKQRK